MCQIESKKIKDKKQVIVSALIILSTLLIAINQNSQTNYQVDLLDAVLTGNGYMMAIIGQSFDNDHLIYIQNLSIEKCHAQEGSSDCRKSREEFEQDYDEVVQNVKLLQERQKSLNEKMSVLEIKHQQPNFIQDLFFYLAIIMNILALSINIRDR